MTDNDEPNLYDLLGIERDASSAAIKAAFLWKRTGSEQADDAPKVDPEKLKLAYAILSNPETRRLYDQTGAIPPQQIDPLPQTQLNLVIADLLGKAIAQMASPQFDDIIKRMRQIALQNLATAHSQAAKLEAIEAKMAAISGRIRTTDDNNLVRLFVTTWQADVPKMIAEIKRAAGLQEQALQYLATYSYQLDEMPDDNI